MSGPSMLNHRAEFERSGRNLAMQTLSLLSNPDVIDRARRTPHARVRTLLDRLAGAQLVEDDHDLGFVLRDDPTKTPRGLDELLEPTLVPEPRSEVPLARVSEAPKPQRSFWGKLVGREG